MKHRLSAVFLLATTLLVAGCDTAEERAENHFEDGVEYYEAGDLSSATLEFRNTLQLMPSHQQARLMLAQIAQQNGDLRAAVNHYRTLLEHYPEMGNAHLALAEIAMDLGDWNTVTRHTGEAAKYVDDSPQLAALMAGIAYREALGDNDEETRRAQAEVALGLVEANPDLVNARRVSIDNLLREEKYAEAMEMVDAGMALDPDRYEYYQLRLGILEQLGLTAEIAPQLQQMVERFPDERAVPLALVRWYLQQEDLDAAEAFLRERAAADPENLDRQTELAQFLRAQRGFDAVNAELTRLSQEGGENAGTYQAMRAALMFENGQVDEAIAELEALLAAQPPADDEEADGAFANDVRVDLARMLVASGRTDEAKALVDTVLAEDPSHVAGLKLRGAWQIDADQISEAVVTLRSALRENPRDPQIMTLMAAAHDRAGETELKREMLALAVEASRSAPEESLRYARELIATENYLSAEDILLDALRLQQGHVGLYTMLGDVYLALDDTPRAEQVLQTLEQISQQSQDPRATAAFNTLQAKLLSLKETPDEFLGFLEGLAEGENGQAAEIALIRTHIARGAVDDARTRLDGLLAEAPEDPVLRYLDASLMAANRQFEEAEAGYRALLEENPQADQVWMTLYRLHQAQNDREGASAILAEALEAIPGSAVLRFTRAGELEASGDPEGAIEIYQALYDANSNVEVVANNLASMLSTYRDTPEDLDRAYVVGRRLQDSPVPAYRDTYGWIAYRKGELEEAERHLRFAAQGYPNHPVVLFHYGMALAGLERNAEAIEQFRNALEADAANGLLPEIDRATLETELARLEAGAAAPDDAAPEGTAATQTE